MGYYGVGRSLGGGLVFTAEAQHLDDTVHVANRFHQDIGPHAVLTVGPEMVPEYHPVAPEARGGCSAGAHGHEVLGHVSTLDAVDVDQPQQLLEIGGDLEAHVEQAVGHVEPPAAVERRMRGHEAHPHLPRGERGRAVVSHRTRRVIGIHIMDVGIYGVHVMDVAGDGGKHIVGGIEIIRVEYPHHISGGHLYPLVHGVVQSVVGLGDPFQPSAIHGLALPYDVECAVGRAAVDNDMLEIRIILPQHALYGVTQRLSTIERRRDY